MSAPPSNFSGLKPPLSILRLDDHNSLFRSQKFVFSSSGIRFYSISVCFL
jgi:hypothetical protein